MCGQQGCAGRDGAGFVRPAAALCTDNGAMIAACGHRGLLAGDVAPLGVDVQPGLRIG